MADNSIAPSEPQEPAVKYSYYLADGAGVVRPGRQWPEVQSPDDAMNLAFAALWDNDRRDIAVEVYSHLEGFDPEIVCFAIKSEDSDAIKYQTADGQWHEREMPDTPEQAARRSVAAIFDSTHVYGQNVTIIDLSSAWSVSGKGTVDALDVTYPEWYGKTPEAVQLYLEQLRTLPLDLLYAHTQKIKGSGRIIKPMQKAIDTIIADTEASGRIHVSEPTVLIDRGLEHRGGFQITPFGGAVVRDFTRLLGILTPEEREAWGAKYERLPVAIREQVEIFHGPRHGARGAGFTLTTLPVVEPIGEKIPVVNFTGDGPADTGPGRYALVTTKPHAIPAGQNVFGKTYRYLVHMPDTADSPTGHIPEFPYDYMQPATVETFRVPAGRAVADTVLHDTPAWRNATSWVPSVGANGKASRVFVLQQVATVA